MDPSKSQGRAAFALPEGMRPSPRVRVGRTVVAGSVFSTVSLLPYRFPSNRPRTGNGTALSFKARSWNPDRVNVPAFACS
jgi:hypothetical protein